MSANGRINSGLLIERSLLLTVVGVLGYACLQIVSPFVPPFLWAMILALSTWPYYLALSRWLGGRTKLAAMLLTLIQLLVFVLPAILALNALAEHAPKLDGLYERVVAWLRGDPPGWLAQIPRVGEGLDSDWRAGKLIDRLDPDKIRPLLAIVGKWVWQGGAGVALNALNIILAVLMAGLLYSYGEAGAAVAERLAQRIGGKAALESIRIAASTVRGVALGVIGTALIQAILSGIGFALAGLAAAPVLGLLCFLTAVLQVGTSLIWIPAAAWLAHIDQDGWAAFTVVWGIAINVMDNFIKPYFIGLSSPLPFLLIIVGVVGGLLAWGFVGIFLGTTLLAVAYATFFAWLDQRPVEET